MSSTTSTITSKFQVTLPEGIRKEFRVTIGERIVWEVQGDLLVGKRLPPLTDLAGALKAGSSSQSLESPGDGWTAATAARDTRIKGQG